MAECRCHELARAVLEELAQPERAWLEDALAAVDGRVGAVEHTWLRFSGSGAVLDVYRPGVHPQVLLVDRLVAADYVPGPARSDVRESVVAYLRRQMGR